MRGGLGQVEDHTRLAFGLCTCKMLNQTYSPADSLAVDTNRIFQGRVKPVRSYGTSLLYVSDSRDPVNTYGVLTQPDSWLVNDGCLGCSETIFRHGSGFKNHFLKNEFKGVYGFPSANDGDFP